MEDLLQRANQRLAALRQGAPESLQQHGERSEKSERSPAPSPQPPAELINDARAAGVELAINPATARLEVTFGPATVQPLPAALILECVRRGPELRPLVEATTRPTPPPEPPAQPQNLGTTC
jgi:hypothetical protein